MIRIETSVLIDRPTEEVFAFISNFENNPLWQAGMVSAEFTSEPPLGIGSTYDQVAKFLGREILSSFEVIEYEPGHLLKATSTTGTFPITFTPGFDTSVPLVATGTGSFTVRASLGGTSDEFLLDTGAAW